jgi:hypothetical protein
MNRRPLRGTADRRGVEVILDVPEHAERLVFGVLVAGRGTVWMDGVALEPAPEGAATTGTSYLAGWNLAGSRPEAYELALERDPARGDVLALSCTGDPGDGFGTVTRGQPADVYPGRRVRLSATIRGEAVDDWAGLWLRLDDAAGRPMFIDNMHDRPLTGTFDWTDVAVTLDVPPETARLPHGVLLRGRGRLWIAGVRLEEVGESVETTATAPAAGGWNLTGSRPDAYGLAPAPDGRGVLLRSTGDPGDGDGAVARFVAAREFRGRAVRFRVDLRGASTGQGAALWLRVDGPGGRQSIVHRPDQPIGGTFDWRREEAVLPVPPEATGIGYGVGLMGPGEVQVDGASLDSVDP